MSQNITITAVRNTSDEDFMGADASRGAGIQLRTSDHDGISAQVTVTIKAVAEPEEPGKPAEPKQSDMPRTGSAIQALAVALLLLVAAAVCAFVTSRLRSS